MRHRSLSCLGGSQSNWPRGQFVDREQARTPAGVYEKPPRHCSDAGALGVRPYLVSTSLRICVNCAACMRTR